jgi:ubiquinone/menaquinone biosynthesis C-methylase UbiE
MINEIVKKIIPAAVYEKEFKIGERAYPFYSFHRPDSEANWSDQMASRLEQPSKHHFIDRYNRKIALDGVKDKLAGKNCCYLDVGCSSGYMIEEVLENFPDVNIIGVDYFSAGILQCHKRLPDIPIFQMDLSNCQFPDNLFDSITCLNVLEHIQDDTSALKHLYRITKPGGKIVITVPMGQNLYDIYDQVHYHVRRYQMPEIINKIRSVGFNVLKNNYFGVFIYPGFYVTKKINKLRFSQASEERKIEIVFKEIKESSHSAFIEYLVNVEYALGKIIRYPFGIRSYILARKN